MCICACIHTQNKHTLLTNTLLTTKYLAGLEKAIPIKVENQGMANQHQWNKDQSAVQDKQKDRDSVLEILGHAVLLVGIVVVLDQQADFVCMYVCMYVCMFVRT
jgi:hypothetical protein